MSPAQAGLHADLPSPSSSRAQLASLIRNPLRCVASLPHPATMRVTLAVLLFASLGESARANG